MKIALTVSCHNNAVVDNGFVLLGGGVLFDWGYGAA